MNKGEWSEFYAFLKLLGEGKLFAADEDLNVTEEYYNLTNILRQLESSKTFAVFHILSDVGVVSVVIPNKSDVDVEQERFLEYANLLLKKILSAKGSFLVPELNDFRKELGYPKVKEMSDKKKDITLTALDVATGRQEVLGFSIKSKLGGDPTLFNPSKSTNFIYELETISPLTDDAINSLNQMKIKKSMSKLLGGGAKLKFSNLSSDVFSDNLKMVDFYMDKILGEVVKLYYSSSPKDLSSLIKLVTDANPLNLSPTLAARFYTHKLKEFLVNCALGMTAAKIWQGFFDANGGYIVVKEDGNILCYHAYNWDKLKSYLLKYSYLETPSTGKHDFGKIYRENGRLYVKLNLQIRFR
ncbi:MAG: HpaII family restriction endonuclease [Alphaproteobacteria bacterium CG_4_10_14_0_8_um_filter_53_9]|nr:MAG: HpaII family restriction endonuclease [Alphaproteobacteria bacterium CG_4_10_14_0_8_um_filter_53_9]